MDIMYEAKVLKLVLSLFDRRKNTVPYIPQVPAKAAVGTLFASVQPLERSTPEKEGLSADYLSRFLAELRDKKAIDMHHVMVLRHGKVVAEGSFGPYPKDMPHETFSLCKSVTALAVGMVRGEGKLSLDDRLIDLLPAQYNALTALRHKNITVRHLLGMRSGLVFNEAFAQTTEQWLKGCGESRLRFEPDDAFYYNSLNSYLLAAIVKEKSGEGLMDYLRPRLLEPMGIRATQWELSPEGIEKGGWGLYLTVEDAAKLGQLVLNGGAWNGSQLVPADFIREATAPQSEVSPSLGAYDYGYHMWVGREQNAVLFSGMFGQNVLIYPEWDMVIASFAGNNEYFQNSRFFDVVHKYFGTAYKPSTQPLPADHAGLARLRTVEASLCASPKKRGVFARFRADRRCKMLYGRKYVFAPADTAGVGLLPLIAQAVHNNHTKGLKSVAFSKAKDNGLVLTMWEGDLRIDLPVGLYGPLVTDIDLYGEPFRVAVEGSFSEEKGDTVLDVRVRFLELANSRTMRFVFGDGVLDVQFGETPGTDYLVAALTAMSADAPDNRFLAEALEKAQNGLIDKIIKESLEPRAHAALSPVRFEG